MHTIKITPNLLFEYQCIQAADLSDCRIESKLFWPELECSSVYLIVSGAYSHVQQPVGGIFACRNGLFDLKSIVERESDGNPLLATRSVISR